MNYHNAIRLPALAALAACLSSLLIAYFYMERYLLLEPCPLCILDRLVVAVMGLGFALLALAGRRWLTWAWMGWGLNLIALSAGFVFAGRHIWLQNRPVDVAAECLADHAAAQGLVELIRRAFDAEADCGAIMWEFAGLTIPEQVLLFFIALAGLQCWLAWALRHLRRASS